MNDANSSNKDELPTGAMRQNAHREHLMNDIVNTKETDSNERDVNKNDRKLPKEL